jgi:hypothetical protein
VTRETNGTLVYDLAASFSISSPVGRVTGTKLSSNFGSSCGPSDDPNANNFAFNTGNLQGFAAADTYEARISTASGVREPGPVCEVHRDVQNRARQVAKPRDLALVVRSVLAVVWSRPAFAGPWYVRRARALPDGLQNTRAVCVERRVVKSRLRRDGRSRA